MAKCPHCGKTSLRSEVFDNYSTAGYNETRLHCYLIVCSSCNSVLGAVPDLDWATPKKK